MKAFRYLAAYGLLWAVLAGGLYPAPAFAQLLRRMAHLDNAPADSAAALSHWAAARIGLDARVVGDMLALASDGLPAVDATRLFPDYLQAVTALRHFIDQWSVD